MMNLEEQERLRKLGCSEREIACMILDEMSDVELKMLARIEKDQYKFEN